MTTRSILHNLISAFALFGHVLGAGPLAHGDVEITIRDHIETTAGQRPPGINPIPPIPPPPAGEYSGVVRITQTSNGLTVRNVLRVAARVSTDGTIVLLTSAPQPPKAAANVEASITSCTRDQRGNYFTDGTNPVQVATQGYVLTVRFCNPPTVVEPAATDTGVVSAIIPSQFATMEFTLRRKAP